MLQLKFGLSLATDLSFTRTNKVIECLDLVDKCIKGIRALSLYFSWSSFLDQKMKPSLTSQPAIAVFQNGPDFILLRSEIGPFWAKKVWEWSRFSLKRKTFAQLLPRLKNRRDLYMPTELLFTLKFHQVNGNWGFIAAVFWNPGQKCDYCPIVQYRKQITAGPTFMPL